MLKKLDKIGMERIMENKEILMRNFLRFVENTEKYLYQNSKDFENYDEDLREISTTFYNFLRWILKEKRTVKDYEKIKEKYNEINKDNAIDKYFGYFKIIIEEIEKGCIYLDEMIKMIETEPFKRYDINGITVFTKELKERNANGSFTVKEALNPEELVKWAIKNLEDNYYSDPRFWDLTPLQVDGQSVWVERHSNEKCSDYISITHEYESIQNLYGVEKLSKTFSVISYICLDTLVD